jgi:hypothetical protein
VKNEVKIHRLLKIFTMWLDGLQKSVFLKLISRKIREKKKKENNREIKKDAV